ncbi:hypothetical protein GCM10018785_42670 [Streptomyces longispororuber]|uniref:Uncharacterized protein n=1 Tax=Streptomyces longispororuber TaxID=68230 RepID=A0A919DQK3_9ACTN|nr:hypothetical protein GCM10018785_42670 [Streptomyces longispororuber]
MAMKVDTKAPRRFTRVLVHSHQKAGGSPDTDSLTARLAAVSGIRVPRAVRMSELALLRACKCPKQ